jgi:hypothetical protein
MKTKKKSSVALLVISKWTNRNVFPLLGILLLCSSCASFVGKGLKPVRIGSTPIGANVVITNKEGSQVYDGVTPATIQLKSTSGFLSKESYKVKLSMEEFEEKIVSLDCKFNMEIISNAFSDKSPPDVLFSLKTKALHENLTKSLPFSIDSIQTLNTNTALSHKGQDIIFVNGFRLGFSRRRDESFQNKLRKRYWDIENKTFTDELNEYFNVNKNHFVNGSYWKGSRAKVREADGYFQGLEMIKSGEINISKENNLITIVMHSQGNAYGVGVANGIIDTGKIMGIEVRVNLVFLSVHQPDSFEVREELKKSGIQFTYVNDNAKIVKPIGKLAGVLDANTENMNWKKDGLKAHSATIDDKTAFEAIKKINNIKKVLTMTD